jgi:hypothetical protein
VSANYSGLSGAGHFSKAQKDLQKSKISQGYFFKYKKKI